MRRFVIAPVEDHAECVTLDREESLHLSRVLRLSVGDRVELIDGTGGLFVGTVQSLGRSVSVRIVSRENPAADPACPLWVYQGNLKGKKMDFLVEKCTELGVQRFVSFSGGRSQGSLSGSRRDRRNERWDTIVKSACKQSGRLTFMDVEAEQDFETLLGRGDLPHETMKILFWEREHGLRLGDLDWQASPAAVCLILGPEGGFTDEEVDRAKQNGWMTVSLGNLTLRAETATISAISITRHLIGLM